MIDLVNNLAWFMVLLILIVCLISLVVGLVLAVWYAWYLLRGWLANNSEE